MDNNNQTGNNKSSLTIIGIILIILLAAGIVMMGFYLFGGSMGSEPTNVPATEAPSQVEPTAPQAAQPTSSGTIVFQSYTVDRERITAGECANISWLVENADLIQLLRDGAMALDQAPANHNHQACLPNPGTYVYRLEASNNAGNSNWMELQVIVDPAADTTTITEAPPDTGSGSTLPPATGTVTVNFFFVNPERINVGQCATIQWEVINADQIRLLRDDVVVVPNGQLQDSFTDCHDKSAIYKYRLEAENSENNYNILELQVIVDP